MSQQETGSSCCSKFDESQFGAEQRHENLIFISEEHQQETGKGLGSKGGGSGKRRWSEEARVKLEELRIQEFQIDSITISGLKLESLVSTGLGCSSSGQQVAALRPTP